MIDLANPPLDYAGRGGPACPLFRQAGLPFPRMLLSLLFSPPFLLTVAHQQPGTPPVRLSGGPPRLCDLVNVFSVWQTFSCTTFPSLRTAPRPRLTSTHHGCRAPMLPDQIRGASLIDYLMFLANSSPFLLITPPVPPPLMPPWLRRTPLLLPPRRLPLCPIRCPENVLTQNQVPFFLFRCGHQGSFT